MTIIRKSVFGLFALGAVAMVALAPASAQQTFRGQVLGAGAPIADAMVTLWAASAGAPGQLAQTRTGPDGRFTLNAPGARGKDATLYLVAKGGTPKAAANKGANDAIALMALLGTSSSQTVTINELTTVASAVARSRSCPFQPSSGAPPVIARAAPPPLPQQDARPELSQYREWPMSAFPPKAAYLADSAKKRTNALQQATSYSITSSAPGVGAGVIILPKMITFDIVRPQYEA